MSTSGTGKSSALAWHHNLKDFMLETSYSLEVSETTEYGNHKETDKVTLSGSLNDASSSGFD